MRKTHGLSATIMALGMGGLAGAGPAMADHAFADRDVIQGQALYGTHCAACHGENLEGQPDWHRRNPDGTMPAPPHDASGHTWHHDSQMLFDYTQLGGAQYLALRGMTDFPSGMPAFGEVLSDGEIWDVLAYIRSTWPAEVQAMQTARTPGHN